MRDCEPSSEKSLDPKDWDAFARASHEALDGMLGWLKTVRERPVWRAPSADARERFSRPLPEEGRALADVVGDVSQFVAPYVTGNIHPLFLGWVHGGGTPAGMVAEMLAAGLNANCGGRNHVGLDVERQIASWAAEMLGFPRTSSGIFVTGSSLANFLALLVARTGALGDGVRERGLQAGDARLTLYAADYAHGCIARAAEMAGLGRLSLRSVPTNGAAGLDVDALSTLVRADRAEGLRPFMVAGTAGSVDCGYFDDLSAVAGFCRENQLWFHVDGAFGALCALSEDLRPLVSGIELADSVAFDFHKWGHVPYDAGFLLVRDPDLHKRSFATANAYLQRAESGLGAGETWPCDLGPDLSRGFRALKTWFTFEVFGRARLAASIEQSCALARYLETRLRTSELFRVEAPVVLNIVCFGVRSDDANDFNRRITIDLQERGVAAPSWTVLDGKCVIRAAILNHRTTRADIDTFLHELETSAKRIGAMPGDDVEGPPGHSLAARVLTGARLPVGKH